MLSELAELRASRVVVTAIDRLGRNMREGIEVACGLIDDRNIHVVALNGVDSSSLGGRQGLYIGLMMAEQEAANISARVKATAAARVWRRSFLTQGDGGCMAADVTTPWSPVKQPS